MDLRGKAGRGVGVMGFHRVNGYLHLPALRAALNATGPPPKFQSGQVSSLGSTATQATTTLEGDRPNHPGSAFQLERMGVDLRCHRDREHWSTRAPIEEPAVVFVRRGCFYRRVDGVESVLDPTVVFFESPGQERMLRHPFVGGDACTWIVLSPGLLASVSADAAIPLLDPLTTNAEIDLEHRLLLRAATAGGDPLETEERVVLGGLLRAQ